MKVIKTEHGIELIPETAHDTECLRHIHGKALTASFADSWDKTGNFVLKFKPHPWDDEDN